MIKPHGSDQLNPLYVRDDQERAKIQREAESLASITLTSAAAANAVMLGSGYFNPLKGYMNREDALRVARENIEANGLTDKIRLSPGVTDPQDELEDEPFDLVSANIFAETLAEMMPFIRSNMAPKGVAVLSGILSDREQIVGAGAIESGLQTVERKEEQGWVTLTLKSARAK